VQGHRAVDTGDHRGLAAVALRQVGREPLDVPERRRHQDELHARQGEERHLPGPAALGIGVEMELVHHHLVDGGIRAVPQREIRQDLGGAADDRGLGVDARIPGDHPHVLSPEDVDEGEELL